MKKFIFSMIAIIVIAICNSTFSFAQTGKENDNLPPNVVGVGGTFEMWIRGEACIGGVGWTFWCQTDENAQFHCEWWMGEACTDPYIHVTGSGPKLAVKTGNGRALIIEPIIPANPIGLLNRMIMTCNNCEEVPIEVQNAVINAIHSNLTE